MMPVAEELRGALLFEGLTDDRLVWCGDFFEITTIAAGDPVSDDGALVHPFFVVLAGEVNVVVDNGCVAELTPGGFWLDDGTYLAEQRVRPVATMRSRVARMLPWDYVAMTAEAGVLEARIHHVMRVRTGIFPWDDGEIRTS